MPNDAFKSMEISVVLGVILNSLRTISCSRLARLGTFVHRNIFLIGFGTILLIETALARVSILSTKSSKFFLLVACAASRLSSLCNTWLYRLLQ